MTAKEKNAQAGSKNELWTDPLQGKDLLTGEEISALVSELSPYLNKGEVTKIVNAWSEGGLIDGTGAVWINTNYLPTIIRTSSSEVARRQRLDAKKIDRIKIDGDWYLSGPAVIAILFRVITTAGNTRARQYAELSNDLGYAILNSSKAKERQRNYVEHMKNLRKNLKARRINELNLSKDELTNEPLDKATAEFSHILPVALYFHYSGKTWNGLIVNKSTHRTITDAKITDDKELIKLCKAHGWKLKWVPEFKKSLEMAA